MHTELLQRRTRELLMWVATGRMPGEPANALGNTSVMGVDESLPLTASDVRNERIDVFAQYSLLRLARQPAFQKDARDMLDAVNSGKLGGIYKEDERVPALRAVKMGTWWGTLIPAGRDAVLVEDPVDPLGVPIIVFRDGIRSNQPRIDAALVNVWRELALDERLDRAFELVDGDDRMSISGGIAIGAGPAKKKVLPRLLPAPAKRKGLAVTRVQVDLKSQTMTVEYDDDTTETTRISSGRGAPGTKGDPCANQGNTNCTPAGSFTVKGLASAGPNHKNRQGDAMPFYVDLITARGIGIHGGQPVLGVPASHGCIRVPTPVAKRLWERVVSTTVVQITGKAPTKAWRPRRK